MQNKPAQRPFLRTSICHTLTRRGEITHRGSAKERSHLCLCTNRPIARSCTTGRIRQRDAPPPRQSGLLIAIAPRIGQPVARKLLHQNERIKRHRLARRFQRHDRLNHRGIRRRATINAAPLKLRNLLGIRARETRHHPRHLAPVHQFRRDFWPNPATVTAQIIAKPRHHQRGCPARRQFFIQHHEGSGKIGLRARRVLIGQNRRCRNTGSRQSR